MRRRDFVTLTGSGLISACTKPGSVASKRPRAPAQALPSFDHGVASGDPATDRVILWTRVTGAVHGTPVGLRVSPSRDLTSALEFSSALDGERDFTVKVDALGLEANTTYYYQFEVAGVRSPVGRTRTLPVGSVDHLRLGFCSCSNLPWGYFNVYRRLAERSDLAAVLHLGDYIYEYKNGDYGDGTAMGRIPEPDREIVSLSDYRLRHAQYKRDVDSQAMHAQHPVIAIWDDHELTDDAWQGGADNHQPDSEGSWQARRDNAVRAYYEWMPIREQGSPRQAVTYRSFRFGDLADLSMLDTRLVGRDRQLASGDPGLKDAQRTILGATQESWLAGEVARSAVDGVAWTVLGQQVMLAPMQRADGSPLSLDKWHGYPEARKRLLELLAKHERDAVVLTGDFHSSWAMDLPLGGSTVGAEFLVPGVSSPGPSEVADPRKTVVELSQHNPHLRWVELTQRGYAVLDLNKEHAQCDWYFVDTVTERSESERFARGYAMPRGNRGLVQKDSPAG